jgi:hypothetical protein
MQGFNNVNAVLKGGSDYAAILLLQILLAKILVTALCRGSGDNVMHAVPGVTFLSIIDDSAGLTNMLCTSAGLVGGIYAPSVFMGGYMLLCNIRLLAHEHVCKSGM